MYLRARSPVLPILQGFMRIDTTLERLETGVSGLDDILGGGLPRGQMYLLEGFPGTGKTTLAMQFILEGVKRGEKTLYITLSESKSELQNSARSHGWRPEDLPIAEFIPAEASLSPDQQYTVFHPSEVELATTIHRLTEVIESVKPDRLVIDSLSELRLLAADTMRYRRQLLALKHYFLGTDATILLLDDRTAEGSDMQLLSIAHGVLRLDKLSRSYGVTRRQVEVLKLRGSAFREGFHDFAIVHGGLVMFPRLISGEHGASRDGERITSNLPALDAMFGGGVKRGTSTLLIGASGCGKSTLAFSFAHAAAKRGERTIAYMFDEVLGTAQDRMHSLGVPVQDEIARGTLTMSQIDPAELSPGELIWQIRHEVETNNTRVVVIDSLNGFLLSMPGERDLILHLHVLLSYLNQKGVATFLTFAQSGLIGSMHSEVDVSYLSDTVVLLRFFETNGELRKVISVVKQRVGEHERTLRELHLTNHRIEIGEPLRSFQGVLTGVPQRQD